MPYYSLVPVISLNAKLNYFHVVQPNYIRLLPLVNIIHRLFKQKLILCSPVVLGFCCLVGFFWLVGWFWYHTSGICLVKYQWLQSGDKVSFSSFQLTWKNETFWGLSIFLLFLSSNSIALLSRFCCSSLTIFSSCHYSQCLHGLSQFCLYYNSSRGTVHFMFIKLWSTETLLLIGIFRHYLIADEK